MKSKRLVLIVAGLLVVVALEAGAWWYFTTSSEAPTEAAVPVATGTATTNPVEPLPPSPAGSAGAPLPAVAPDEPTVITYGPNKGQPLPGPLPAKKPPDFTPPIPDNPDAKAAPSEEDRKVMDQKYRAASFCTSAEDARMPLRDFVLRERGTPTKGAPSQVGPRVSYPGFPVVVYTFSGDRSKAFLGTEARRAAVAQGICTWALPLVVIPAGGTDSLQAFQAQPTIEVYLPVAAGEKVAAPLKAGEVEGGLAYVGKPMRVTKASPPDLAAFLAEVRASGATPRGPLLARQDDRGTLDRDDDTVQFIQPITVP